MAGGMMYAQAISGGIQQKYHGYAVRAVNEANNRLSAQNAESTNKLRAAANAQVAATNNLNRWVQSVNNQRRMDSAGEALESTVVNARRQADKALTSSFASDISRAEAAGQMASSAAMAGVSGDVVDQVNTSVALRDSIVRQEFSDNLELGKSDVARRAGNIMSQMVGGMDASLIQDSFNYNLEVPVYTPSLSTFYNFVQGAFKGLGMGSGLDGGGDEPVYAPKETHGTDFNGNAKFSFNDDNYLSLDSNQGGNDWTDRALGEDSSRGYNSFSNQFEDMDNTYTKAWQKSGTDMGGSGSYWSW